VQRSKPPLPLRRGEKVHEANRSVTCIETRDSSFDGSEKKIPHRL
jgi:hypothetical protein